MKKILMIGFLIVIFSALTLLTPARSETNKDIQEIKERLIRLEAKVEEGQKRLEDGLKYTNTRMDDINKRVDDLRGGISDLKNFNYVILAAIVSLVGFVLWDRRTALVV